MKYLLLFLLVSCGSQKGVIISKQNTEKRFPLMQIKNGDSIYTVRTTNYNAKQLNIGDTIK